jgi:hypothetical protein
MNMRPLVAVLLLLLPLFAHGEDYKYLEYSISSSVYITIPTNFEMKASPKAYPHFTVEFDERTRLEHIEDALKLNLKIRSTKFTLETKGKKNLIFFVIPFGCKSCKS